MNKNEWKCTKWNFRVWSLGLKTLKHAFHTFPLFQLFIHEWTKLELITQFYIFSHIYLMRAGEPANFLAALAPASAFFTSSSGSGCWFFSQAALAPAPGIFFRAAPAPAPRGQKHLAPAPALWQNILSPTN